MTVPRVSRSRSAKVGMSNRGVLKFSSAEQCPDIEKHTACPSGYVAWHEWAERMRKTHKQERCPTCGYWSIWRKKK